MISYLIPLAFLQWGLLGLPKPLGEQGCYLGCELRAGLSGVHKPGGLSPLDSNDMNVGQLVLTHPCDKGQGWGGRLSFQVGL